jgi:osmotically-inducible protein OsmY
MTRAATTESAPISVEQVRTVLLEKRPSASDQINALVITNDSGIITLRGKVNDESTHMDLVNRVRSMSNVRGVRDEIQVQPKTAMNPDEQVGTTSTTGAQQGTTDMGGTSTDKMDHTGAGPSGSMNQGTTMAGDQTGATSTTASKPELVRQSMMTAKPASSEIIQALTITANDDGSIVTVKGSVPDEGTHQALLKAAKGTEGVKTVKDQMKVEKKKAQPTPKP